MEIIDEVKRDFFDGNPVEVQENVQGYKIDADGKYILGMRAGPSVDINHLFHEMAHLAEREVDKLVQRYPVGWGYHFGKFWRCGGCSGYEPQNSKGTLREARCFAYQFSLAQYYLGTSWENFDYYESATFLSDWDIYRREVCPYDTSSVELYTRSKVDSLVAYRDHIHSLLDNFSFENFKIEWAKRMEALKVKSPCPN